MRLIRSIIRLSLFALVLYGAYALGKRFAPAPVAEAPVITHHSVLQEITEMGKLELVKYNFKDIVEYEKPVNSYQKFVLGQTKAVLIVNGEAIGCIDLTKILPTDLVEDRDTLIVYLPQPELCVSKINHEQSRVYNVQTAYFDDSGPAVSEAYLAAERKINQSALEMGILEQTRTNAEKILMPFLESVSGKKVLLRYRLTGDLQRLKR